MMTNAELLALLHERFGIGNNNLPINNANVTDMDIVIQMEDKDDEEDSVNNDDDSDYMGEENEEENHNEHEESDGIIDAKPQGKPMPRMDHDDILIEVMDVVPSNDNVSLHIPPTTNKVRADNTTANADSAFSVDHCDDVIMDVNADAPSNVHVSDASTDPGFACNAAFIGKLLQEDKVKEMHQLCLSCTVGLKKLSGTCCRLETISPCEFLN